MSPQKGSDQSAEVEQRDERRPEPSRRSVLHGAAGLAGAGLVATAVAGTLAAPVAAASDGAGRWGQSQQSARPRRSGREAGTAGSGDPVIVHVRDLASGDMDVFAGETKATLRDPALAARLAHAVH